jgi:hypothetical protein
MRSNTCTNLGVVCGAHDAVEVVAADAIEQRFFCVSVPGKLASHSGIGELLGQVLGRPQLDSAVVVRPAATSARLRASRSVADGANGERVAAGRKPRRGKLNRPLLSLTTEIVSSNPRAWR